MLSRPLSPLDFVLIPWKSLKKFLFCVIPVSTIPVSCFGLALIPCKSCVVPMCLFHVVPVLSSMTFPPDSVSIPGESRVHLTLIPCLSRVIPILSLPRSSLGFALIPWKSHVSPMSFPCHSRVMCPSFLFWIGLNPMEIPCNLFRAIPMSFPCIFPFLILPEFHGNPMFSPWIFHGIPMCFLRVPPVSFLCHPRLCRHWILP